MNELLLALDRLDGQLTERHACFRRKECRNEFARLYACKHFSQSDEDGLTIEMIKRINISSTARTFLEVGVGNGQENNTLVLLSMGWHGAWLGGEELCFNPITSSNKLTFIRSWINSDNITQLAFQALERAKVDPGQLGLLSIDLDGNDFYLLQMILKAGIHPEIIICEYNAIFPPNVQWSLAYNSDHQWRGDHLFGASLLTFADLLKKFGYFLVACNPGTGCNAFFTKETYRGSFPDVPCSIEDIYMPPYYRINNKFHHAISPQFLQAIV